MSDLKKRYLVRITFSYIKLLSDIQDKKPKEYYFEVGRRLNRQRTPTNGYFRFGKNNLVQLKSPIVLYTEIVTTKPHTEVEIPLTLKEKSQNLLKSDKIVFFIPMTTEIGKKPETQIIKENNAEIKITISSSESTI